MTGTSETRRPPSGSETASARDLGNRGRRPIRQWLKSVPNYLRRSLTTATSRLRHTGHREAGDIVAAKEAIFIRAGALACAVSSSRLGHPNEVGGILVGYRTSSALVVTDTISLPTEPTPYRYQRDHAVAESALLAYLAMMPTLSPEGYIGEWHSHPTCHSASLQDLTELSDIAGIAHELVGLLVLGLGEAEVEPYGYLCDRQGLPRSVPVKTAELAGENQLITPGG
jgi:proteasome lid subunit RPN8/RPN11